MKRSSYWGPSLSRATSFTPIGVPNHTGLVQAIGRNGFVLIESKWGQLDVYWHTPADQGYADHWEYWRSTRAGHRLDVQGGNELF